jgi:hypothetical protein
MRIDRGAKVLGYMSRVGKSRRDLIARELIILLDVFDLVPAVNLPSTVATSILVPVMQGLPKRIAGSIEIPG